MLGFTLLVLYLYPGLAAIKAKHPHAGMVFLLNLVFGWTLIGWFVCLALSWYAPRR